MSKLPDPIIIENVSPELADGSFPIKAVVGEKITVRADIFKDGHDVIRASVKYKERSSFLGDWKEAFMEELGNDTWEASFPITSSKSSSTFIYTVEAWSDPIQTWLDSLEKKYEAGLIFNKQEDLLEGIILLKELIFRIPREHNFLISDIGKALEAYPDSANEIDTEALMKLISNDAFRKLVYLFPLKKLLTKYKKELEIIVDRQLALFSSWYELFPRSQSDEINKHGTFRDCIEKLGYLKYMGFDVLYLPPIHPIGRTNRKGKNNSLQAFSDDIGSPWAIGSHEGGHKDIHPELGTLEDFKALLEKAKENDMEIAIDLAFQCSPDHPYVKYHSEWFYKEPSGKIKFAENPPKKYQDIYPLDFSCKNAEDLWNELKEVVLFWINAGVKMFRVDNPHTKPFRFWQWLIEGIREIHPDVIFLAEAFTMPKRMKFLAKAGFTQSYTYFTWRVSKKEITDYMNELTRTEMKYYFRPNFFTNTPDILPFHLQNANEAMFKIRLLLAATLSSNYGIYAGYEFFENEALGENKEEYLNSEKYELKQRDLNKKPNLIDLLSTINHIRQTNSAFHDFRNIKFLETHNDELIAYLKISGKSRIITVINLNANEAKEGWIELPLELLKIQENSEYIVEDLLTNESYLWRGKVNYVKLDPNMRVPAHILKI